MGSASPRSGKRRTGSRSRRATVSTSKAASSSKLGRRDGQVRSGLKAAAWKCERLGNIGQNKPAKSKPDDAAPARANGGDRREQAPSDWQRPGAMDDDQIPF